MSYYPGADSRTRDISKVLSNLSKYTTKKELKDAKWSTSNITLSVI